jgi:hypothetical protein
MGSKLFAQNPIISPVKPSKMRIMCGVVEMNKEAEWAKTAPYCELHRPTRRYTHSNRNIVIGILFYLLKKFLPYPLKIMLWAQTITFQAMPPLARHHKI